MAAYTEAPQWGSEYFYQLEASVPLLSVFGPHRLPDLVQVAQYSQENGQRQASAGVIERQRRCEAHPAQLRNVFIGAAALESTGADVAPSQAERLCKSLLLEATHAAEPGYFLPYPERIRIVPEEAADLLPHGALVLGNSAVYVGQSGGGMRTAGGEAARRIQCAMQAVAARAMPLGASLEAVHTRLGTL